MGEFLPFPGLRYDPGRFSDLTAVCAPPYDVIEPDERVALERRSPFNAVRLILPERYEAAAAALREWRSRGVLQRDDSPTLSVYRMEFERDGELHTTTGVIGALSVDAERGDVLPHERTLPKAKSDRLELLRATRTNLDPIWGLSLARGLSALLPTRGRPHASAVDDHGTRHSLWCVDDPAQLAAIGRTVGAAGVVLADGHHRFETAAAYDGERRAAGVADPGAAHIMAFVVELAPEQLCVRAIHRLLTGVGPGDVRETVAGTFDVRDAGPNTPEGVAALEDAMRDHRALGLVDGRGLALLLPRPTLETRLEQGDVDEALRDVDSARFDIGIRQVVPHAHLAYRDDAAAVAAQVEKGAADAAVLLRPVSVDTIRAVAEAGLRMPEKTTYFAPKPRTGMVFRCLDDG